MPSSRGDRSPARRGVGPALVLRALLAAAVLPGTATILVPSLLLRGDAGSLAIGPARFAALLTLAAGTAGLAWCIADFARLGRGTLAPVDPPRFVVRGGLYRWVRNPMYVCVLMMVASEGILFASRAVLTWAAVLALGFHVFVVLYEEPTLARMFGAAYEDYRRRVPRWVPRLGGKRGAP